MPNRGVSNGRGRLGVWLRRALVGCGVLAGGGVAASRIKGITEGLPPASKYFLQHNPPLYHSRWPEDAGGLVDECSGGMAMAHLYLRNVSGVITGCARRMYLASPGVYALPKALAT